VERRPCRHLGWHRLRRRRREHGNVEQDLDAAEAGLPGSRLLVLDAPVQLAPGEVAGIARRPGGPAAVAFQSAWLSKRLGPRQCWRGPSDPRCPGPRAS
jgi:hypothetical protein